MDSLFDLAIIGGGINGCGCAADASLRGLKVILCEQSDLGAKASSNSTKLIHGGLRYLENGEISLVRKALIERQLLATLAPHLIKPLSFVLPHNKQMRPIWMLYAGLFLYDHLTFKNKMPKSEFISVTKNYKYFTPLKDSLNKGFMFSECMVDDARLVIENALQAQKYGATISPGTKLVHSQVANNIWELAFQKEDGKVFQIKARSVINATGPWVEKVSNILRIPTNKSIAKVKGSHIIVPKLYENEQAYVLQHDDKRIIFVIPYFNHTLIGTTEISYNSSISSASITEEEVFYLLGIVNAHFKKEITAEDILFNYSGIRPLIYSPRREERKLSRNYDYTLLNSPAPVITIYGGKITTYRQLAVKIINQLKSIFPNLPKSKTAFTPLPGSNINQHSWETYQEYAINKYHWLNLEILKRYFACYGTLTEHILNNCNSMDDLGIFFGDTIYQVEIDYLVQNEWAKTIDDILWRRTKLGLSVKEETEIKLNDYLVSLNTMPENPEIEDALSTI